MLLHVSVDDNLISYVLLTVQTLKYAPLITCCCDWLNTSSLLDLDWSLISNLECSAHLLH